MAVKCVHCGAEIVYGKPHEMKVKMTAKGITRTLTEFWCEPCIEWYSEAIWPEEEYGPFPRRINQNVSKRPS
jgi:hypothetical protein